MGIKNVEVMNIVLISKWKWMILVEDDAIWKDILVSRYVNIKLKALVGDVSIIRNSDSIWWRDTITSDNYVSLFYQNFSGAINCRVGNGKAVPFWHDNWAGKQPSSHSFP